ncbi:MULTISPECIES: TetR/AcrR family transcriptional regulator [unclassified Streptomyces]|uniref:TetR/AcrR family transcriptional regulator n=1 Tax=unclassified Streptomyces TaxID=2593676 RepID=UPI00202ECF5E|nr:MULTISPECIES: TetR/AcrR family transcriptional regulator [unclassified Streptomyces]MCM1971462.1 TetR/AcrR family transcriptional regulator [Streptomyces sp. G1]MCX5125111.1 TetR/AcrR family transcriptional regulator [Streptomyces sp. NBC_00347]MCX5299071.1 TetR/AcrR family transcriptional regulator [Streptomyces sp. NBC_00193]
MSITPSSNSASNPPRTGGRLRNEDAHHSVLEATAALLVENGYGALTIEGVAKRANVAKSTVYRWWKSKPALVMDAYAHETAARVPEPDTGTLTGDLTAFVTDLYRIGGDPVRAKALTGLMAEAQLDPAFADPFRAWVATRREIVAALLARAVTREELPAGTDLDHATDLIFGPFWYRLLVAHAPLDPADARAHVTTVLHGLTGHAELP